VISLATWILWVHILAAALWLGGAATVSTAVLPFAGAERAVAVRRAHFLTSRAMEVLLLTGVINVLLKGLQGGFTLGRGFFAMLSLKMALLVVMAGLQIWMGVIWRRTGAGETDVVRRARVGLSLQCALGAVAALLGLGLRAA
jgi:uncharacterized membrane protein